MFKLITSSLAKPQQRNQGFDSNQQFQDQKGFNNHQNQENNQTNIYRLQFAKDASKKSNIQQQQFEAMSRLDKSELQFALYQTQQLLLKTDAKCELLEKQYQEKERIILEKELEIQVLKSKKTYNTPNSQKIKQLDARCQQLEKDLERATAAYNDKDYEHKKSQLKCKMIEKQLSILFEKHARLLQHHKELKEQLSQYGNIQSRNSDGENFNEIIIIEDSDPFLKCQDQNFDINQISRILEENNRMMDENCKINEELKQIEETRNNLSAVKFFLTSKKPNLFSSINQSD